MLTKADFQAKIAESITLYPTLAQLFQTQDPRLLQHLDAIAAMLSMMSANIEVAQSEPFDKVRDATVLADAAMRGIVRKGTAARVRIKASNRGNTNYVVSTGRVVIDSAGHPYQIETAVTVPATGNATFEAVQLRSLAISHTVAGTEPFYAIEVPAADDDSFLHGIAVADGDGYYSYRERYVNTVAGDRVFHVEVDDRQRVFVRFGYRNVVGTQPLDGQVITLTVTYTAGAVEPAYESPFAFDYIASPEESAVEFKLDAMLVPGQNPIAMSVLRDLSRYPSVYDTNAVFLGEFDFLVRRNFPTLKFLSIWNEAAEERARGASVNNINTLFVACLSSIGGETVLTEANPASPVAPTAIADVNLTGTQLAVKAKIAAADDSYKIKFMTPVRSKITVAITAKVASSFVDVTVSNQIREAILAEFGEEAAASRRGLSKPLYQRVYAMLRQKVPALTGSSEADLIVSITDHPSAVARPELWRYVAPDTLTVTVVTANAAAPPWGW